MRIKKGDTVKVLYGRDSGKTGKVLNVDTKKNLVVVEGVNQHRKHVKGDGQTKKSEVVTILKPMPVAKLMLLDVDSGKPTRVRYETEGGAKIRVSVKTGKPIDPDTNKEKTDKKKSTKNEKKATKKTTKKTPKKKKESKSKKSKK